jgi:penicillin-binding protein 2
MQVSQRLRQPIAFDPIDFQRHYEARLALPYPIVRNLNSTQVALFQEQATSPLGVDLEILSTRYYPFGTTAAHLLGRLQRDDSSVEGEESFFSYRLPDYRGTVGVEALFDRELRGQAGAKSVLVNNVGYRQTENVWSDAEPGTNVVLTIDLRIQQAAEQALLDVYGPTTRGAAVVLDVRNGDILAMASSPTLNPNSFINGITHAEWQKITGMRAEPNRATQEHYPPGSVFKTVVGLALLEAGHNPRAVYNVAPNPHQPNKGVYYVGKRVIRDLAPPGPYDFRRAIVRSSNSYFVENGLRLGPEPIVRLAQQLYLGQRTGLGTRQEVAGYIPDLKRLNSGWTDGNTANMCIGQDPVLVTPLQVAVMTAALANDGTVFWPRLAQRLEPQSSALEQAAITFPGERVRAQLKLKPRSLSVLHEAMLAEVEDSEGTGSGAELPGLKVCGKTGTAQVQDELNRKTGQITWFASFAPYDQPRWAVVVMVEEGVSGGATCAPAARKIYTSILESTKGPVRPPLARSE